MAGMEFGRKGPEGLKGEGISETSGWASLKETPFAGEDMVEQADKINELLESIPELESETSTPQKAENVKDDTQKQIDALKANLHSLFE